MTRRSKQNRKYRERNPEKARAHKIVSRNKRLGRLIQLPCFMCGELETEAHHATYQYPLAVTWLCHEHHKELHESFDSM